MADYKNHSYAIEEFAIHPDLKDVNGKAVKVIEDLMYKTVIDCSIGGDTAISTLQYIQEKHSHLEELTTIFIGLLEEYDKY